MACVDVRGMFDPPPSTSPQVRVKQEVFINYFYNCYLWALDDDIMKRLTARNGAMDAAVVDNCLKDRRNYEKRTGFVAPPGAEWLTILLSEG